MQVILCDFDGTLVTNAYPATGEPVEKMVKVIRAHLAFGDTVRIFTNRADRESDCVPVREFCKAHFGQVLEVTNLKTRDVTVIYDDIAIQVIRDTGELVGIDR